MPFIIFLCIFCASCASNDQAFFKAVDKKWKPAENGEASIRQGGREILFILKIKEVEISNILIFDEAKSQNEAYYLQTISISEKLSIQRSVGIKIENNTLLWMGYKADALESSMPSEQNLSEWEGFRNRWWGKPSVDFESEGLILGK